MKLIQDKDTQMRIDGLPEIYRTVRKLEAEVDRLAVNYTGLCEIVSSTEGRLEKHIEMSDEPRVRMRGSRGMLGYRDLILLPISKVIQMLLDHLNLELTEERMVLKEIVDDDKTTTTNTTE